MVKNLSAKQETWVQSLGQEDPLEEGTATRSSILAWRIPWTEELGGLSCLENPMDREAWWAAVHGVAKSRTRLSDFTFTFYFHALEKKMTTHSSVLAWRIQGQRSLMDCHLWVRTESDMTEVT